MALCGRLVSRFVANRDQWSRLRAEGAMGLSSVMYTALSGMNAATTLVDVSADNLANAQTPGFKAGTVQFGTLTPETLSFGSPVVAGSAGSNPIQVGQGVMVSGITRDFSQGSIATSDQPGLLALDG